MLAEGADLPEILQTLCWRFKVQKCQARRYVERAFEEMRARDSLIPDANIHRIVYQERLLSDYRELGKLSRSRKGNGHRVQAIKARVEIAERLAELDGVRPRDPDGGAGGGFTLVLDLDPEPGSADGS